MPAPVYNYQTPQWMNTNPYMPQNYNAAMQNFQTQLVVQNMLNNGQMSQQQFNACRVMANQITGMNF